MNHLLKGIVTALVTPFSKKGIDEQGLANMVRYQLDAGVSGFVVNGTTAESPCLTGEEVEAIFRMVRSLSSNNIPVVLGTGSNCTAKTISATQRAEQMGADGALVVVPYYNKPNQRGIFEHFKAVAESVQFPIYLYHIPGRCVVGLELGTIAELAKIPNIVGIKDATGDMEFAKNIRKVVPKEFLLFSGDDGSCFDFFANGGDGAISVMSHLIPKQSCRWFSSAKSDQKLKSEFETALPFINSLYIEPNPTVTKWALFEMGQIESYQLRLPLIGLDTIGQQKVRPHLQSMGLV